MKKISLISLFLIALLMVQCNSEDFPLVPEGSTPLEWAANQLAVTEADNTFGFKMMQQLHESDPEENLFASPFSVAMALGMTMNGAVGDTQDEMRSVLEKNELDMDNINEAYQGLLARLPALDENVVMNLANSIWYNEFNFEPNQEFLATASEYFNSEVAELNFQDPASLAIINGWIEDATEGKIQDMLDEIPPNAIMYLVNAIYFNASWKYAFELEDTQPADFNLADGSTTTCDMMHMVADLPYYANEHFQAVDLAYGDAVFSMTVLLPQANKTVEEVMATLDNDSWKTCLQELEVAPSLTLNMPRFSLEYKEELKATLQAMGMELPFDPWMADFSNLGTSPSNLSISRVIHQSFIDVNEEGTEAAAATVVEIVFNTSDIPQMVTLNRPFIFVIRENVSNTILFVGKVMNPTE